MSVPKLSLEHAGHVCCRDNLSTTRKELLNETGVQFRILIKTTVLHDNEAIVAITRVHQGGEHDSAGGDAEEDQRINLGLRARSFPDLYPRTHLPGAW